MNALSIPIRDAHQGRYEQSTVQSEFWHVPRMVEDFEKLSSTLKVEPMLSYSFLSVIQDVARNLETGITGAAEDAEAHEVQCRSLYRI